MRRWSKVLLWGAGVLVAVLPVWFFCVRESEPSYKGRTLSEWLELCAPTWPYDRTGNPRAKTAEYQDEAMVAVRNIGTNAIPTLLKWAVAKNSKGREAFHNLLDKHIPDRIIFVIGPTVWSGAAERKRQLCLAGFQILGTNAAAAVPELTRIFNSGDPLTEVPNAGTCLRNTGQQGLHVLATGLCENATSAQCFSASKEFANLNRFDTNAECVVPQLLRAVDGRADPISRNAMSVLGHLALCPKQVIPVLTNQLSSTNWANRQMALQAIGNFGTNATAVLSAVRAELDDKDAKVSSAAAMALTKILQGDRSTN